MSKEEIKKAQEKVSEEEKDNSENEKVEETKVEKKSEEGLEPQGKKSSKRVENKLESLEEAIAKEKISEKIRESEYTHELSREPVQALYNEMVGLQKEVEEKGYINQEEQKKVEYFISAIEQKLEDNDAGKYSFTEQTAMKASLIQQVGSQLRNMYKGNDSNQKSFYKSG